MKSLRCLLLRHRWMDVFTPKDGGSPIYLDSNGLQVTYWTALSGGEQLEIIEGKRCIRCGLTVWDDES